jgi:predicted RNase H-like HicB family nuclease
MKEKEPGMEGGWTMEIPVLIEPMSGNGYRAWVMDPLALMAEGATPEEALQKLGALLQNRLAHGSRIVGLEVPLPGHPAARCAGSIRGDPLVEDLREAIAEYRRKKYEDPDAPSVCLSSTRTSSPYNGKNTRSFVSRYRSTLPEG